MSDNNIQDTLEVFMTIVMYGAAITIIVVATFLANRNLDFLSNRIDEKQSIGTAVGQDIDTRDDVSPAFLAGSLTKKQKKDELTRTEVLDSILAINTDITTVQINSTVLSKDTIKQAQNGDERSKIKLLQKINEHNKYERINIYDTDAQGDFLSIIMFTNT